MHELPDDVEIPNSYTYYERAAIIIASISSCPGSQSSHIFFGAIYDSLEYYNINL